MKSKIGFIQLIAPLLATNLYAASRLTLVGPNIDALFQAAGEKAAETVSKPSVGQEQEVPTPPQTNKRETKELTVQVKTDADGEISIDLDNIEPFRPAKGGDIPAKNVLLQYGIKTRTVPDDTQLNVKEGKYYTGTQFDIPASQNILMQQGRNEQVTSFWTFDPPIDSIAFDRPGLIAADENGFWYPEWSVTVIFLKERLPNGKNIYDSKTYGEGKGTQGIHHFDTEHPYPKWRIDTQNDIKGKKIVQVIFESNGYGRAGVPSVTPCNIVIRRSK